METDQVEISPEIKLSIEVVAMQAFADVLKAATDAFERQMASSLSDYLQMQSHSTQNVIDRMNAGNRQAQGVPNNG